MTQLKLKTIVSIKQLISLSQTTTEMTSSRRSSISADLSGDTKRSSQLKITKSVIAQLQKVAEQEEKELLVYAVREELMRRVMDEIYKRYLEQQSIRFTVDCAHKALVQILKTEFYVHDKVKENIKVFLFFIYL